jgi:hypothetical protein
MIIYKLICRTNYSIELREREKRKENDRGKENNIVKYEI